MKNQILRELRSLSTKDIAFLTHSKNYARGKEYFEQGRVVAFTWFKGYTELVALIRGSSTNYQIKIRLDEDHQRGLSYVCNCPAWDEYDLCKHVICSIITASCLLNDKDVPGYASSTLKIQLLKNIDEHVETQASSSHHKKEPIISRTIHITYDEKSHMYMKPQSCITLYLGEKKLRTNSPETPLEYKGFLLKQMNSDKREKNLCHALVKQKIVDPIIIHTKKGPLTITAHGAPQVYPWTEMALIDDNIQIKRIAKSSNNEVLEDLVQIGDYLVIDEVKKQCAILPKEDHWSWIRNTLYQSGYTWNKHPEDKISVDRYDNDQEFSFPELSKPVIIPTRTFNRTLKLTYDRYDLIKQSFIFKQNGHVVEPQTAQPKRVIVGSIDKNKQLVYLYAQTHINNQSIPFDYALHKHIASKNSSLSYWMLSKDREVFSTTATFSLIGMKDKKHAFEHIEALTAEFCSKHNRNKYDGYTLDNYLKNFYDLLQNAPREQIVCDGTNLYRVSLDNHFLWQPFKLLSELFSDFYISDTNKHEHFFGIPTAIFFDSFSTLEKTASEHNIEIRLNDKQVKTVAMDVSIDASNRSDDDWFDVTPEILSKGIPLTKEQRNFLFGGEEFVEEADCFAVLDAQTREIIKLLAKIFTPTGAASGKSENEIARLPRLRVLDLLELRESGATVTLSKEDEELIDRLTNFSKIEKIPLPKKFKGDLRDYQIIGYRWLAFLYSYRFGACLADDMGLGKTVQTIAFLGSIAENIIKNRHTQKTPHLIIVPPTLIFNWQNELKTFYPDLTTFIYAGSGRKNTFEGYDIVLTTYDTVRIDIENLKKMNFHVIILDEAQAIKNIKSGRTAAIRQLKSTFTLSITGTPLENHIGEYYSIFDVALPSLLPTYQKFMGSTGDDNHKNLIKKMNVFVLRRTKETILKELPPKVESNIILEMTHRQEKIYATTVAEVKRTIEEAYNSKTGAQAKIIALTAILRLRQICISPQLIDKKSIQDSPKIDYLMDALTELIQEGHAALVFSQFTSCLDIIENALKDSDLPYFRIDGSISITQRKKIIESFQNNDQNVSILLLSLKTGGVGLNLTRANYVFHVDPWWNPAVENQASDRSHRIGQRNTVFVTRLVMHHTIEEKMMALKEAKQKLFKDIMDNAENKKSGLISKKDFELLLK